MATILEQQKRLEKLSPKITVNNVFAALKEAEKIIIATNQFQLNKGEDSDGNIVGVYKRGTQGYATDQRPIKDKIQGEPYNFQWFGDFFDGFELSVSGIDATISSAGVGQGGKKAFLTTNNLFGLQEDNLKKIIKEEILPFMNKVARDTLMI